MGNKTFYIKNEDGEFVEANDQVDELFREKSGDIVSAKLAKAKEKIRAEIEDDVRNNATDSIRAEVKSAVDAEWQTKLDASEKRATDLETSLRRKTIAAEYGLKPEFEKFLGNGDEEEMKANADILKTTGTGYKAPDKTDVKENVTKTQQSTGIRVEI